MLRISFYVPTKIVFHRESIEQVGKEASSFGRKALIVCGRSFARRSGYLDKIRGLLEREGLRVVIFDKVEPNPSFETVEKGSKLARDENVDVVIGFGGGSAMDAAKGIAVLASKGGAITDYVYPHEVTGDVLPIIAIPTTCGTGSEVTRYAVFSDLRRKRKVTMVGYPILPKVALLDPLVLRSLPPNLTAYTGMDALSHAIEAYLSKRSNPLSDLLALESIRLIFWNLKEACRGSLEAREKVFYASMLAGMAINCTGTIMVHGMGYYLTMYHDIHHGLANAFLLPFAVEYNAPALPSKMTRLADVLGMGPLSPSEVGRAISRAICRLEDEVNIPVSLSEVGVSEDELDDMVKEALSYHRNLANNPRKVTPEDVRTIYLKALKGRGSCG